MGVDAISEIRVMCEESVAREGAGARVILKVRSRPRRPRGGRIRVLAGVIGEILDDSRQEGWWVVSVPSSKLLKAISASLGHPLQ